MTSWLAIKNQILSGLPLSFDSYSAPVKIAITVAVAILLCGLLIGILKFFRRSKEDEASSLDIVSAADPVEVQESAPVTNMVLDTPLAYSFDDVLSAITDIRRVSELVGSTAASDDMRDKNWIIENSARDAERRLKNIILLGQAETGNVPKAKPQSVHFGHIITGITDRWKKSIKSSSVEFTHHIDSALPECLFLDNQSFAQTIDNLLENAVRQTRSGRIHLHITGEAVSKFDWGLKIVVVNTGSGYSAEFVKSIADGNMTGQKVLSNSQNLLAAKALAQLMGGNLSLTSKEGRGSEIAISLPAREAVVVETPVTTNPGTTENSSTGLLQGRRVLIIEDDTSSQEVLKACLEPENCEIDCISDGASALVTLAQNRYDLIFMDVRMPGLNGIETTKAIRTSHRDFRNIPIIAITADIAPETNAKCMTAGVDLFLTKPVSAKGLFDGIRFVMLSNADLKALNA